MQLTGERHVPGSSGWLIELEHLARYDACKSISNGKEVLDAACGAGYGSRLLASTAAAVTGVDIDPETVAFARTHYSAPNVRFEAASVVDLPFPAATFDVITSFETFEHMNANDQSAFLDEAKRVLKGDGVLIVSTPDKNVTDTFGTDNPYHLREVTESQFREEIGTRFAKVDLFRQSTMIYSEIARAGVDRQSLMAEMTSDPAKGQNMIAVCTNGAVIADISCLMRSPRGYLECEAEWLRQIAQVRADFEGSASWRLTAPLRLIRGMLRR